MLEAIALRDILFIDIETVPLKPQLGDLTSEMQRLWEYRIQRYRPNEAEPADYYFEKAGVYAEFGKVVCISLGFFALANAENADYQLRVKTFYGADEVEDVLRPFFALLAAMPDRYYLCGHNIREFDIPFLCRRAVINRLPIPHLLNIADLKPWEIKHLDTMLLWRFGDVRNMTSLHLLCSVLQIETPKNDMEGKDVARVFWHENDLTRIMHYNRRDIIAVAQLILRFKQMPPLDADTQTIWVEV
jgi:hypothetical protein